MRRAALAVLPLMACGAGPGESSHGWANEVVEFQAGAGAGYGQSDLPGVVVGPPDGRGASAGTLDVVSLGAGGEIVLGFGPRAIVDGPGADLVIFENAFWAGGDRTQPWAEPGEVAVSEDGVEWHTWPCDPGGGDGFEWPGCAGWTPTLEFDSEDLTVLDPEVTGGDAFDLADLGLQRARFVRVRDVSHRGGAPSAGFDLDAIGAAYLD